MYRELASGSYDNGLPPAASTALPTSSGILLQAGGYLENSCSTDTGTFHIHNIPPVVKRERPDFLSEGICPYSKRARAERLVKTTTSILDLTSPNLQRPEHQYAAATTFPTSAAARDSLEDGIASLLSQMSNAHHDLHSKFYHRNISLMARSACTLPGQLNIITVLNESARIMFVPHSFKMGDIGYGTNFIHKITLLSNLSHANLSTSEHWSLCKGSVKPLSSPLRQSKGRQQIVHPIEGMWYY